MFDDPYPAETRLDRPEYAEARALIARKAQFREVIEAAEERLMDLADDLGVDVLASIKHGLSDILGDADGAFDRAIDRELNT